MSAATKARERSSEDSPDETTRRLRTTMINPNAAAHAPSTGASNSGGKETKIVSTTGKIYIEPPKEAPAPMKRGGSSGIRPSLLKSNTVCGMSAPQAERAKEMFKELDTDNSGYIDHGELKKALKNLGIQASDAEVSFLLARADSDGSGELDYREFLKIIAPYIKQRYAASGAETMSDGDVKSALSDEFSRSLAMIREVEAIRQALAKNKYVIDPAGRFMRYWDPITMIALLFTAVVTPAEIAFAEPAYDALYFMNRLIDAIFVTDMFVQLFLAYADNSQGGRTVKDLKMIRSRYFHGWFIIDFFSVLPIDQMGPLLSPEQDDDTLDDAAAAAGSNKAMESVRVLRLMRLVRILKMARVLRANRIFQRWECEISIPFATISMIKFGFAIMFCAHWVACLWGMTAAIQDDTS